MEKKKNKEKRKIHLIVENGRVDSILCDDDTEVEFINFDLDGCSDEQRLELQAYVNGLRVKGRHKEIIC